MRTVAPALLTLCLLPAAAAAQETAVAERYYVVLFGGQGNVFRPQTAHTWATFVRTAVTADGERLVAADTISWLPATLNVRPLARYEEVGRNLTLAETLSFSADRPRSRIAAFGPYEITPQAYQQALAQKALLESGAVRYHSLGLYGRRADVMHCVDAITRMDADWEASVSPSWRFGQAATIEAARGAARTGVIVNPGVTHPWLLEAVVPDGYRLAPRPLRNRTLVRP